MWQQVPRSFEGRTGVVVGTGPSLTPDVLDTLRAASDWHPLFGMNNTYKDLPLHVHVACDPQWWQTYGPDVELRNHRAHKWTWDPDTHARFPYTRLVRGQWGDGLSTDPDYIHYGHSSSYQALNLAVLYGCHRVLLVGFDMRYPTGAPRHYFDGLSDAAGEYPPRLRKYSKFDGLIQCFWTIARQKGLPQIINCTPDSALQCFKTGNLLDYVRTKETPT